jgi:hypothetical protein
VRPAETEKICEELERRDEQREALLFGGLEEIEDHPTKPLREDELACV